MRILSGGWEGNAWDTLSSEKGRRESGSWPGSWRGMAMISSGAVPDLVGLPGIHIECKRVERLNLHDAMAQAERDSERFQDGVPAVFHRRSRSPWLVTMKLEDWGRLYSV